MPHSHPERQRGARLEDELLDRAREQAKPLRVEVVVSTATGRDADELRSRQLAALVRLLRHAVEIHRAA